MTASQECFERAHESNVCRLRIELARGRDLPSQEPRNVGDDRREHSHLGVARLRDKRKEAKDASPRLVRPPALAQRLTTKDTDPPHHALHAQLLEQTRLARATLASDQDRRALTCRGMREQSTQSLELAIA